MKETKEPEELDLGEPILDTFSYELKLKHDLHTAENEITQELHTWWTIHGTGMFNLHEAARRMSWTAQRLHMTYGHGLILKKGFPNELIVANTYQNRNWINHRVWAYILSQSGLVPKGIEVQAPLNQLILLQTAKQIDPITLLENRLTLLQYLRSEYGRRISTEAEPGKPGAAETS